MNGLEAEFVDSHTHLDDTQFDGDRDAVVERAMAAGVSRIVTLGVDLASSEVAIALAEKFPAVYAGVGIHPHEASTYTTAVLPELERLAHRGRVVAIGETGLDYYRRRSPEAVQREVFAAQLRLAGELGLPVVVHDREAHGDVLRLLAEESGRRGADAKVNGVMHCFSGDAELAARIVALGLHISFAGPVTYKQDQVLGDVVRAVPDDRLLLETDCPYLAPQPVRGQRNEPAHVVFTYQRLAQLRAIPLAELARMAKDNAVKLFGEKLR